MLGECCPSGRDSSLNLLALLFVSGAVSMSQVDVVFNVHDMRHDILMCRFPSSPLSSMCSSSDPDFHFQQLMPVAFVMAHVEY